MKNWRWRSWRRKPRSRWKRPWPRSPQINLTWLLPIYRCRDLTFFALVGQLKEEFPDLPVLALSGYAGTEEIEAHNFVGLIEKPMQINDCQQMIDDTLGKPG